MTCLCSRLWICIHRTPRVGNAQHSSLFRLVHHGGKPAHNGPMHSNQWTIMQQIFANAHPLMMQLQTNSGWLFAKSRHSDKWNGNGTNNWISLLPTSLLQGTFSNPVPHAMAYYSVVGKASWTLSLLCVWINELQSLHLLFVIILNPRKWHTHEPIRRHVSPHHFPSLFW